MRLLAALARHRPAALAALVGAAVVLRALLVAFCPAPFGYVFDYYHEAIEIFWASGRLPVAADCWQCYHPPVFYVLGVVPYAAARFLARSAEDPAVWGQHALAIVSIAATATTLVYGYRTIRFLVRDRALSLVGAALLLAFPCAFIATDAPEADVIVTALMSVFLFRLVVFASRPGKASWRDAIELGIVAGLAAATKYSGLIALATAGIATGLLLVTGGSPRRLSPVRAPRLKTIGLGLLILAVTILVGGWKYVDNARHHGTPLFANGSAGDAFSEEHEYFWDHYDFTSLDLAGAIAVTGPHAPAGELTTLPIYRSVWTVLYAMGWGDLSFFSVAGRIGDTEAPYPDKHIPTWLTGAVLYLGLVPTLLAFVGALRMVPRRPWWPLVAMFVLTLASYLPWVLAQDDWALKTKYILFLLPIYVAWSLAGLRWVTRRMPAFVGDTVVALLGALVVAAFAWQAVFATF